jgi:4-hydroxybutyrate dehydrogenase/sulfolactaldehyde 3-reductase
MTKMTATSQENVMPVIAFIGLGQMGSPMASNLLKQGHQLSVFDVNPDAVQRLVEKGTTCQ